MSKLEKLDALAKAATPGPWACVGVRKVESGPIYRWVVGDGTQAVSRIENTVSGRPLTEEDAANAEFIATFNPHLVQEVLSWVKEARPLLESVADRVQHEYPENAETSGVRMCCGAASFRPHLPSCHTQGVLEKIRKFDEGDL